VRRMCNQDSHIGGRMGTDVHGPARADSLRDAGQGLWKQIAPRPGVVVRERVHQCGVQHPQVALPCKFLCHDVVDTTDGNEWHEPLCALPLDPPMAGSTFGDHGEPQRAPLTRQKRTHLGTRAAVSVPPMRRLDIRTGTTGYRDQLDRTRRFLERILAARAAGYVVDYQDDVWAFFQNCWHLKDWVKHDPLVPKDVKDRIVSAAEVSTVLAMPRRCCLDSWGNDS
jgi:hypothetical protein